MEAARCVQCGREMTDPTAVCPDCGHQADKPSETWTLPVEPLQTPRHPDSFSPEPFDAPAPPSPPPPHPRGRRRELLFVVAAFAAGGLVTVPLFTYRAAPSSEAAAAEPPPAAHASALVLDKSPGAAASPGSAPGWSRKNRAVWLGNRRNGEVFERAAENSVAVWMRSVRPALVVRCLDRATEVFVFTDSAARMEPDTEDHTVTYSVDDGPPTTERWPDSLKHDALFAPDGAAFARLLARAGTMRFAFTPHNAAPVVAHFQVEGLAPMLASAARECGWRE